MQKSKSLFFVAVAIASVAMLTGDCSAQCNTCNQAPAVSFGYPSSSGGCNSCRGGGCSLGSGELRSRLEQTKQINARTAARNAAWPKPFACADRQLYHQMWRPMVDQGYQEQCLIGAAHFDPETGKLNRFGQTAVAAIMQNMPMAHKEVFLHKSHDQQVNDLRMASVKDTINTFYASSGPARVAYSNLPPVSIRGEQAAAIYQKALEGMPAPVIPVGSGGSVAAAVGGQ
ncbi:MAG: hypothetical protein AB8B55_12290 [Mariniblastus sp.]